MNVLITGTSSGIGYGLAHEFLKRDCHVWGISRRPNTELSGHPNFSYLQLDLTQSEEVVKLLPGFISGTDQFELVVLNAGILGEIKYMNETPVEEMKRVMEINVWANKTLLDLLFQLELKISQVVGMSSKAALRSSPGWGPYCLSKAGLDMLMNIYAKEYPDTHFSAFAPGLVDSEIQDYIFAILDVEKYPSAKNLQEARYTEKMPDAIDAAPKLIKGMEKALTYESGTHVDVREM
jgi:NAD(P)-dependent dehydrogenase (short-subunit alcohol dehydrogenase family)